MSSPQRHPPPLPQRQPVPPPRPPSRPSARSDPSSLLQDPSLGFSGGGLPPRPTVSGTRRRPFVAPHRPHATSIPLGGSGGNRIPPPGGDGCSGDDRMPSPRGGGSGLPRRLPNDPPPLAHRTLSFREPHATTWDAGRSTRSSTDVYEVTGDDFSPNYWTPDYSPAGPHCVLPMISQSVTNSEHADQEPTSSSSQYFTNLMRQAVVGDVGQVQLDADVVQAQPDATPSTGGKVASKRGSNYTQHEDIQLCKSWIHISNDPIIGNDQSGKTYWERIANDFHSNRDFESDRTANSLEHRFGIILKDCMKFHGYYEEVERRHPSGIPYQEHLLQAQTRYAGKFKGKHCQFIHCWLELRHTQKFESTFHSNKRPAKSRELNLPVGSQQDDESTARGQESSSMPSTKNARPPGRKQSKEKLKKNEGDDKFEEMMQNFMVIKAEEHKIKKQRWENDMMIEQRRLKMEEERLQWDQEKQVMFCDVSMMDDEQRAYVKWKRAQINKAVGASVGETTSGESGV